MSANNFDFLSREKFNEILDTYLNGLPEKRRAKAIISRELMDWAIRIFDDGNTNQDPKFKSWVRKKFTIVDIGNVTIQSLLKRQAENLYVLKKICMTLSVPYTAYYNMLAIRKLTMR